MPAEGRLAPQAKVGVNARRELSEEDERDIAKPLTTRRGLAYTYLVYGGNYICWELYVMARIIND